MNAKSEKRLLIVANTPSENTARLARAAQKGAAENGAPPLFFSPPEAGAKEVLAARAVLIGTTENFGYMSGQIKDFFERIYYPCLDNTRALPWALYVRAGKDGAGTLRAVQSIVAGLGWRQMQPPLLLRGEWRDSFAEECENLGAVIAAGLDAGIF